MKAQDDRVDRFGIDLHWQSITIDSLQRWQTMEKWESLVRVVARFNPINVRSIDKNRSGAPSTPTIGGVAAPRDADVFCFVLFFLIRRRVSATPRPAPQGVSGFPPFFLKKKYFDDHFLVRFLCFAIGREVEHKNICLRLRFFRRSRRKWRQTCVESSE